MEKYNKVNTICSEYGCRLLTTFEDFEKKRKDVLQQSYHYVRIDFVGLCGHNSSAVVTNFVSRQTGTRCKECVLMNTKNTLKYSVTNIHNKTYTGLVIIKSYLSNVYNTIRTTEGCMADLVINKKGDDRYLPIQVKVTEAMNIHKMYSFNQINNKENIILICVSISDKKIWVIPNNAVNHLPKINISQRSKYNAYLVHDNNVLDTYINKYADEYYTTDLTKYTTPVAALQQREQQYVKKREEYVNFLEYIYPDIQHTATDFIVNDKKVQEKVVSIYEKKLSLQLAANNGRKDDGSRNFRTYRLGENDFYWCHSPIDDRFWIIPESILFQRGYISDSDVTLNRKAAYITKLTKWIKPYEFNYKNVNKERIISIFAGEVPEEIPEEVPEEVPDKTDNYNCKKVGKYDNDGNLLGTYNSISEAAKINNISRSTISAVCRGVPHYNTAAGFIWKYIAST